MMWLVVVLLLVIIGLLAVVLFELGHVKRMVWSMAQGLRVSVPIE